MNRDQIKAEIANNIFERICSITAPCDETPFFVTPEIALKLHSHVRDGLLQMILALEIENENSCKGIKRSIFLHDIDRELSVPGCKDRLISRARCASHKFCPFGEIDVVEMQSYRTTHSLVMEKFKRYLEIYSKF